MIRCGSVWLPDAETHLQGMLAASHRSIGREAYQLAKYRAAMTHVRARRTAVDAGAAVGMWTMEMARDFKLVEAFEPVPRHLECLVRNLSGIDNVRIHPVALGAWDGLARMTLVDGNTGLSHVSPEGTVEVEVRVLDDFGLEHVDLLKLDVEGFEVAVLEGGLETLRRCRPVVVVEENLGKAARCGRGDLAASRLLEREGARMVADLRGDLVFAWP